MSIIARQSTARTTLIGPVLDADGAAVTDCVVGDFKISKGGGAPAALNGSATLTHRNTGHYSLALTASDLDTVGEATVVIDDTTNACPPKTVTVVEEAVYDALFAASAPGYVANAPVNVAQISGDATAADNAEAFFDGTGYAGTNNVIPTVTNLTNAPTNGDLTATMKASVQTAVGSALTSYGAATGGQVSTVGDDVTALSSSISSILTTLGTDGDGLTAIPWNAAWDAEVQSEAEDALIAHNLDHLLKSAVDTDFATTVHLNSVLGHMADNGTSASFSRTTDSLEALRDNHPANFSALGINASGHVSRVTLVDDVTTKSGYSLTQSFPSNFAAMVISAGGVVSADAVALSGDGTAADNAEAFFDGTGYAGTGNTIPTVTTLTNKTGFELTSGERDSIAAALLDLSNGIETSLTPRQALRLISAAVGGELAGAGTTTITIRNTADSKTRITATVDSDGNRTAVTYDLT